MAIGAASGAGYGALREHFDPSKAERENSRVEKYVKQLASDYGVDPAALLSLAQSESGMRQYDKHGDLLHDYMGGSHVGAMQLSPDVAARYHAHADDAFSNIGGGTQYLRDLRNHYNGDYAKAIGAYAMGQSGMDAALAGKASLSDDARRDITNYLKSQGKSGDVQIGSVTIHVTQGPGEHAKEFADRVVSKLNDFKNKQVQRNLLEFQAQGTSY
jgi:soluble lytic murein transglycosylase-like protein